MIWLHGMAGNVAGQCVCGLAGRIQFHWLPTDPFPKVICLNLGNVFHLKYSCDESSAHAEGQVCRQNGAKV